jgi:TetR/AcrR family transcriptional regulator
MPKSRATFQSELVQEWEQSAIGRRIVRDIRQYSVARRIVAAAQQMFAEKGLAGTRMDEIARLAGVSLALLYSYFRNKEELHRFVIETLIAQVPAQMELPSVVSMDPPDRLRTFVNTSFDFVLSNPEYPRLIQREVVEARRTLHRMVRAHHRPLHRRIVNTIREGIKRGQFRVVDPDQTVFTILGMVMFYFATGPLASQIWNRDVWNRRNVTRRRRAVLDFLEHGLFIRPAAHT